VSFEPVVRTAYRTTKVAPLDGLPVTNVRPLLSLTRTETVATYVPGARRAVTRRLRVSNLYFVGSVDAAILIDPTVLVRTTEITWKTRSERTAFPRFVILVRKNPSSRVFSLVCSARSIGTPSFVSPTVNVTDDPEVAGIAIMSGARGLRGVVKRASGRHGLSDEHASGVGKTAGPAVGIGVEVEV
jgi:hypothetical protein